MNKQINTLFTLLLPVLFVLSCNKNQDNILNSKSDIYIKNEKLNSYRIYCRSNNVGQLMLSINSDEGISKVYVLNDPDNIPITDINISGLLLEEEDGLRLINLDNDETYLFTLSKSDGNLTDEIKISGFGSYLSDLPSNLDFIINERSFYQSVYLYYCNLNHIPPDPVQLEKFERKILPLNQRDNIPTSCGSVSCSVSYTLGYVGYSCSRTCGSGYNAVCSFISGFPWVTCTCEPCPPISGGGGGTSS